jgi:hypothetical protein
MFRVRPASAGQTAAKSSFQQSARRGVDSRGLTLPWSRDVKPSASAFGFDESSRSRCCRWVRWVNPQTGASEPLGHDFSEQGARRRRVGRQQHQGRIRVAYVPLGSLGGLSRWSGLELRILRQQTGWIREVLSRSTGGTPPPVGDSQRDRSIKGSPVDPGLATGDDETHTIDALSSMSTLQPVPERVLVPAAITGSGQH